MTRPCSWPQQGSVELFFYDELDPQARDAMAAHLKDCNECANVLAELELIRDALASQPDVSEPPAGDWSGFMRRLGGAVGTGFSRPTWAGRLKPASTGSRALLATAALLAIVTISVFFVSKEQSSFVAPVENAAAPVATTGLKAAGEDHFERSKLVVLGLAAKEPTATTVEDWAYERELATSLLKDTRLYRMAAEQHGMTSLAGVMRDLELVLLETSMAEKADPKALGHIQRLIEKRGLIEKMDTVATIGM